MTTSNWSDAAGRFEQAERERHAQWEAQCKSDREKREAAEKKAREDEQEARTATVELNEFVRSEEYKAALRLLKASRELISLGRIEHEGRPGWSHSSGIKKEGPTSDTSYYLNEGGFKKCLNSWHATYHGDFEPSDNDPVIAPLEEVALAAVKSGKKPVLAYIRAELDKIAAKAK